MVDDDEEDDEGAHSSAVEIEFVFHYLFSLEKIYLIFINSLIDLNMHDVVIKFSCIKKNAQIQELFSLTVLLNSQLKNRHIQKQMQPSRYYHQPKETVLVTNKENNISSDHPLFYVKQKNYFLEQLSNKVALQGKFNQIDLKKNVRVSHLIQRHSKINHNIHKQQRKRQQFLSSDQFVPVMGMSEQQKKRKKEQRQAEKLREQLYRGYIQQSIIHQAPQRDTHWPSSDYQQFQLVKQNQHLQNFTILSSHYSDPNRRKQLYLLDMEIGKLRQQQNLQKLVKKKQNECSNNELLGRMSNTILSSYMVNFEEIFNCLMDELLEEEVLYFNSLQAGFHLNQEGIKQYKYQQTTKQQKTIYKNNVHYKSSQQLSADSRAIKMMQLLKCLDELAYD